MKWFARRTEKFTRMNLYQHLSRVMTKCRDFVPQIDGLRFVAIIAVLAYHIRAIIAWHYGVVDTPAGTDGLVNWTFGAGCKGVELFFAQRIYSWRAVCTTISRSGGTCPA